MSTMFEARAANALDHLWSDDNFTDITLVTEDQKQVKAHKVILSLFSEFFRDVFLMTSNQNLILYLKGINSTNLQLVLKFIYFGKCDLSQEDLKSFMDTASDLKVNGVTEFLSTFDINQSPKKVNEYISDITETRVPNTTITNSDEFSETDQLEEMVTGEDNFETAISEEKVINKVFTTPIIQPAKRSGNGKYLCDQCEGEFANQTGLRRHKLSKHMGVRFQCEECDFQSPRQNSLKTHKLNKHVTERVQCGQCEYQFYFESDLNKHTQAKHVLIAPIISNDYGDIYNIM